MNPQLLATLKSRLSPEDRELFDRLVATLAEVKEFSRLEPEQQAQLNLLVERYREQAEDVHEEYQQQDRANELWLPETSFGEYARQLLARHLNRQFSSEEEAYLYAFDHRFVPPELKEPEVAKEVFERFMDDIIEANRWRDELVDTHSDPVMAVGLTWFMFIYQMASRLRGEN